jgi:hypothetical protein
MNNLEFVEIMDRTFIGRAIEEIATETGFEPVRYAVDNNRLWWRLKQGHSHMLVVLLGDILRIQLVVGSVDFLLSDPKSLEDLKSFLLKTVIGGVRSG